MIELLLQFIGDFDGYSHNAKSLIVHMEICQIVAADNPRGQPSPLSR